jgi:hypothetical protein
VVFSTPAGSVSLSSFSPAGGSGQQQQSSGGGFQQQSSSASAQHQAAAMAPMQPMQPMAPMPAMQQQSWWPAELGVPASSGAQNDLRYAVFPATGRLAVERNGRCRVFDVGDRIISGISLQSTGGDLILSTPDGDRPLSHFPEISQTPHERQAESASAAAEAPSIATTCSADDPYAALERLGALKAKGILTEEEFSSKKAELLARL